MQGKSKAHILADKKGVTIDYIVDDALTIFYADNSADVVAFIFAHFPPAVRKQIHHKAIQWLKPGGKIILEAFNPNQLNNHSGGPKDVSMLYTEEMIRNDFEGLDIEILQSVHTRLNEGKYHEGIARYNSICRNQERSNSLLKKINRLVSTYIIKQHSIREF